VKVFRKYRLELRWNKVRYKKGLAILEGAYFTGPVLKEAAQIQHNDQLILDMTEQHLVFVPEYYQATLKWGQVTYDKDRVFLEGATIKGKYVNSIDTLKDNEWVLINCRQHEEKKHPFHLVYFAEIKRETGEDKF
jgi:hypothetical protein